MKIAKRKEDILPLNISPLCQTFELLAKKTWIDLHDAYSSNLGLGEESITDYNLLHLRRAHPTEVYIRKYTRQQEAETGADWIWWFGALDGWFGMRVQAKKLNSSYLTYDGIKKIVKKRNKSQIDILIDGAKSDDLVPLYCFYNSWDSGKFHPGWNCKTFPFKIEDLGCAVAHADIVKSVMSNSTQLQDINPISWPWMCLVCCTGHAKGRDSLPHRARSFIRGELTGGDSELSDIRGKMPRIVASIIENQELTESDYYNKENDVAGILVIRESGKK